MKKTSIIITSAEAIGNNPDLLTQILLRLPTKPILKFKCVSKQWHSLISSPHFCLSHTRHHQTNGVLTPTALLLKWFYTLPSEFDVVPLKHNSKVPFFDYMNAPNINVLQSCYGLFLCGSLFDDGPYNNGIIISRYFICNPTTKKFKELSFPRKSFQGSKFYVNLAFDPLKSPHYKIISIREVFGKPSKFELDIYSSETDSWSESRIFFDVKKPIRFEDAVFCNGKIHWNTYRNWWNSYQDESLYYDVVNESLEPMPMPMPTRDFCEKGHYFGECRGILYIAIHCLNRVCSEFHVFEMASDYSHWFLKHRLDIGDLVKLFPGKMWGYGLNSLAFTDVCIAQFKIEEEPRVVVWADKKVVCYDFEDGAWKWHYDLRPGFDFDSYYNDYSEDDDLLPYESIHAYQYFENLSSI